MNNSVCKTCDDRGEIGGFEHGAAPGYVTMPCPDCAPFKPSIIKLDEPPRYECVLSDVPTVDRLIASNAEIMLSMDDRETIVGLRVFVEDRSEAGAPSREAIAKIVDAPAFRQWESLRAYCLRTGDNDAEATKVADHTHGADKEAALAKADAIRALYPTPPAPAVLASREGVAEQEAWNLIQNICACAAEFGDPTRPDTRKDVISPLASIIADRNVLLEMSKSWPKFCDPSGPFDTMALLRAEATARLRVAELEALLSSPPAAGEHVGGAGVGWRPIETAPKDGTPVLLFFPKRYQGKGGISWGCFVNGEWLDSRAIRDNDASHWMHLPAPPSSAGAQAPAHGTAREP